MSGIAGFRLETSVPLVNGYHGTISPLVPGMTLSPQTYADSGADSILDAARLTKDGLRADVVWAAATVTDATAMAAIRAYKVSPRLPHTSIRVYQVQLAPLHVAPLAILEEVRSRLLRGDSLQSLVQEYWAPTGHWHLREILAPYLAVGQEIAPASEAQTYVPRWVRYNEDCERAQLL